MRAHTTTTTTRSRPGHGARHAVVALIVCALAVPASANAYLGGATEEPAAGGYSSVNAITGASSGSSQAACRSASACSDPTTVNAITGGSGGSADVDSGYSSLNAITGSPSDAPTFASSSPTASADGFDWPSALVGAGAALALTALGSAALLTVRRRGTVAASPSTS